MFPRRAKTGGFARVPARRAADNSPARECRESMTQPDRVRASGRHFRIQALLLAVLALLLASTSSSATGTRFNDLGHRLMCTCGCGQVLLECNHVGCQSSDRMRGELQARIDAGDSDDTILQWFVSKYGTTVLAAPTGHGFNRVAWIMPFAAFAFGIAFCVFVVRTWNRRQRPAAANVPHTAQLDEMRRRAREETEI
jgi:cytochrome c-type biogenesis protein CcmH